MNSQIMADAILVSSAVSLVLAGVIFVKTEEFKSLRDAIKPSRKKEKDFKTSRKLQADPQYARPLIMVFAGQQIQKNSHQFIETTLPDSILREYAYVEKYFKKIEQVKVFSLVDDEFSLAKSPPVVRRQSIALECPV